MKIDDFLVYFASALLLVNSPNNIQKNTIYLLLQFNVWGSWYVILFRRQKEEFEIPNDQLCNDVVATHIYSYFFTQTSHSPAAQCNLPGGQNPSVSVIYTGNTNVELNQFNDFEEGEQYHCNLLCRRRYKHSDISRLRSFYKIQFLLLDRQHLTTVFDRN